MTQGWLIDTNVLSELMRDAPAPAVMVWFANHVSHSTFICSITQAEILSGIALLPEGKRRNALADAATALFETDMAGRSLYFDAAAARHCALIRAQRQRAGLPISTEDAQIAAIALTADLHLVTRNTKDFADIEGLTVVNPWQDH